MRIRAFLAVALLAAGLAGPETLAAASDGPALQSIARKSVRRAPKVVPLPRPKDMTAEEARAALAPEGRVTATGAPTPAAAAPVDAAQSPDVPQDPAAARGRLRSLYAVSVLVNRCGFPITTRQGYLLDRTVGALERSLKLDGQQADALYSDVDMTLYRGGGSRLCGAEGKQAKTFRATLGTLHAP